MKINTNIDLKTKKILIKTISVLLLTQGTYILITTIFDIFKYTNQIASKTIEYFQFQETLKRFIIDGISIIADAILGFMFFFSHSSKIKTIHYLIAIIIFFLPFILNQQILSQVEKVIPTVNNPITTVYAQTSSQQSINDLQYQLQQYRNAHQEYLSAKNSYLNFNTLNSKEIAINKTKILLSKRTQTLLSYVFALRVNLLELPLNQQPLDLITQLASKEEFLSDHLKQIEVITTLDQINSISQNLQSQYPQIQILSYQSLLRLIQEHQEIQRQLLIAQHQNLEKLLLEDTNNELDTQQINKWLNDSNQSLNLSPESQKTLDDLVKKLKPITSSLVPNQRNFSKILNLLDQTRTQLLKSVGFLQETIKLFKYG